MKSRTNISRLNVHLARTTWGDLPKAAICSFRTLSEEYGLSVAHGDLQLLDRRWYVTQSGLLRIGTAPERFIVRAREIRREPRECTGHCHPDKVPCRQEECEDVR